MRQQDVLIGNKVIGAESGVFVIAEIGINHDGSYNQGCELIDAAVECGADAVKFQCFRADHLMLPSEDRYSQQHEGLESAYQMLRRLELSWGDHEKLKKHADERGILFLETPFDAEAVDFLDYIGVPAFKVASADLTCLPLLRHIAAKGKPVFLSTGMAYLSEVADAVWALKSGGVTEIALLHCVSAYPAPPHSMNLRALETLREYFGFPVGLSDHSEGIMLALVAAGLGAAVIEKHFTLNKQAPGPDHKSSMDPDELRKLVRMLRDVEAGLGDGRKRPSELEEEGRLLCRRSLVTLVEIRAHERISPWMLSYKRPGGGIEPRHWDKVIGMKARHDLRKNAVLRWEDLVPSAVPDTLNGDLNQDHQFIAPVQIPETKPHA
jgi:N,N'-diacetyllegionaminate synthase